MSQIIEFGPFDKPYYVAHVGHLAPLDGALDGSFRRAWCHPFGKGHKTPRAAAQHAARLMEAQWRDRT